MRQTTDAYELQNINEIEADGFAPCNVLWAVADRFPNKDYIEVKKKITDVSDLGNWQEDEDPMDYIDMDAYNTAKIGFELSFEVDDSYDDEEIHKVTMLLHANTDEDLEYIQGIVEEVYDTRVKILYGKPKIVWVLVYHTADKPERGMVSGVYSTKDLAEKALTDLRDSLGDFITDYEFNRKELVEE